MGIRFDLDQIINQVGRDKGINKQVLIEALESAVLSAAKKHFGHNLN
ncbi:MAG TPA: NusA N-terminal domain-containing protein, partial [Oligoflexia bacterium]|nr:NusA N-terminal domain-containing protein [Oligoflexia bacterium]